MGRFGPILSGFFVCVFFSKLFTCLQYEGDSRQRRSVEATYVTIQDGLNFPNAMRLVGSSALALPMDCLRPIVCDSLAIHLNMASTGAWDTLQQSKLRLSPIEHRWQLTLDC